MYWIITILWSIVGTLFFWRHLSKRWNKLNPIDKMFIPVLSRSHFIPAEPDTGYLGLQFSIVRHAVVFLISALVLYFAKPYVVISILFSLNTLYCWFPISRYRFRRQDLKETAASPDKAHYVDLLSALVKDSFCTVVHTICCVLILFILLAIKP